MADNELNDEQLVKFSEEYELIELANARAVKIQILIKETEKVNTIFHYIAHCY